MKNEKLDRHSSLFNLHCSLSVLLAGVFALVASGAWAAAYWTGKGSNELFTTEGNWASSPTWNIVFDNAKEEVTSPLIRLNQNYESEFKVPGDSYNRRRSLIFRGLPEGSSEWFLCGWYNGEIHKYHQGATSGENGSFVVSDDCSMTIVRISAIDLTATTFTIGKTGTSNAGEVILDVCDLDGTTYRGPAALKSKGEANIYNGSLTINSGTFTVDTGKVMYLGREGAGGITVNAGGTAAFNGDFYIGHGGGTGTLTINNGGTVEVSSGKWVRLGYNDSSKGTINLNGGTLKVKHIHGDSGSCTVNFNSGTILANATYTSNGGLIHSGVTVNVNVGGGVIDNGGNAIQIAAAIGGTGGLTFTGGDTTTLNGAINYTGATFVTPGTTLAVANETAKNNILANGLVLAGVPTVVGQTVMTYTSDLTGADLSKVTCPLAPTTTFAIGGDGNKSIVVASVGEFVAPSTENYWTGAANDGNLSNDANWSQNEVPTGNANIFSTVPAMLTKGDKFAPTSITFLAGSANVTIGGDDFTGMVAVTNHSVASHTINAKVYFTGNIQVKQAAMAETGDLTKAHVMFAGGAYAADGHALESGNSAAGYSRCIFGKYYLKSTSTSRWTAQHQGGSKRVCVADDSYLYIPYAGNTKELYVGNGAKVDIGDMETSNRLSYQVYGEMVVTNLTVSGTGDLYVSYNQDAAPLGVFKFYKVDNQKTGGWFYFADANKTSKHKFYIGKGGLISSSSSSRYCIGRDSSGNYEIISPWNDDFTIGARADKNYNLIFRYGVEFHTDDANNKGRRITIEAKTRTANSGTTITVSGSGSVIVTNTYDNAAQPTVTVKDTATLAFAAGASLGTGTITLGDGTKLVLTADSKDYTLGNKLNLPSGENEVATIRIDGVRRRAGDDQEIATVASGTGVALDPNSTVLAGRDGRLEVKDGKLCLTIRSGGTMIVIR